MVSLMRLVPTWNCNTSFSCASAWPVTRTRCVRKWVPTALQMKPCSDALLRRLQLHVSSSFDTRLQWLQFQPTLSGGHVLREGGAAVTALPM